MSKKTPNKHVWIDRDGRQRTDSWHPARKSDGLLPLLSLTLPPVEGGLAVWEGRGREGVAEMIGHADLDGSRGSEVRDQVAGETHASGIVSPSSRLPSIRDETLSPGFRQGEAITESTSEPVLLPSLYYAADDTEGDGQEEGRSGKQALTRLSDKPSAMEQFLNFRQEEKRRKIGAIENGEFPAHTAQMLREVFCPATPDPAIKRRNRATGVAKQTFMLMPHETLLYEHFKMNAHVPDTHQDLPSHSQSRDVFGGSRLQDEHLEETEKYAMDLRGFIAFMKDSGLIPRQFVLDGIKSALPIQYSLAVQVFKIRQSETVARDRFGRFGFPEFKDTIHKFFHLGSEILQEQIDQRLQKIEKLELKIARHVPNSPDPISDLKKYFSQLFDTIFDAYIYFDHAGDWKVTMSGFRQQCKKLGVPLTGADLYAALLNRTQLSFLDQYTFIHTFGWYPLIVKPKVQVALYKVNPIEASLHRMFCLMSDGVRPEDALAEAKRAASKAQERLASAETQRLASEQSQGGEQSHVVISPTHSWTTLRRGSSELEKTTLRRGSLELQNEEVPLLVANNKNFVGKWKRTASERVLDGGSSPLYAVYESSNSPIHRPSRKLDGGGSPLSAVFSPLSISPSNGNNSPPGMRRSSTTTDDIPQGSFRRISMSSDGPQKRDSPPPIRQGSMHALRQRSNSDTAEGFGEQRRFSEESHFAILEDEGSSDDGGSFDGTQRGKSAQEPMTLETNPAIDSSDHSMAFQTFVDCLKALELVPVAEDRDGGKGLGAEKEAVGQKTDLGSAEFEIALEIFRETTGKGDRLEWQEFKDCLHGFLRTGLRRLHSRRTEAEAELFKMRVRMSKFAPSYENPVAAFKDVLSMRFDTVYDAFVYFDLSGDWQITKAEVKNMMRRLLSPLTNVDVDAAMNQVFLTSGISINAIDFVRKIKWTKDLAKKVLEDYSIADHEKELYEEFLQFNSKNMNRDHGHTPNTPNTPNTQKTEEGDGGRAGLTLPGTNMMVKDGFPMIQKKRLTKEDIAQKKQEAEIRVSQEGFMDFAIASGIVKLSSNPQVELAQRAFQSVNWADDKDNEISWPEFKHVLFTYFTKGPAMLLPTLDSKKQELRMKRLDLYQKVKTQPDSVQAMRDSFADRFDSVFDAFCYFDVSGDGYVTLNDIKNMLPKLRMAMTVADLNGAIMKVMKVRESKGDIVVDPMVFSKNFAWHPKPKASPGLRAALDAAKKRRAQVVEKAHARAEAAPAPIPTEPDILSDDAQVVERLQKQVEEIVALQQELRETDEVCGCPIDDSLALPDAELARRKELAQQDLRERALRASDRGITELLDRAAKNKMRIVETAQQRSQDEDYARKMMGLKDGVREPPKVAMLMQWAPKTEKLELRLQQEKLNRLHAAIERLSEVKEVLGVPIKDLAVSTKDRYRKQEIDDHNREVQRIAVQGIHTMVLDGMEKAKLRRKDIVALARKRAEDLHPDWVQIPFPSETVQQALAWFTEMALKRVDQEKRALHMQLQSSQQSTDFGHAKTSPQPPKQKQQHHIVQRDKGPISPERIAASVAPMTKALQHRFANIYDAWAFFDADGSWEITKSEFRKRSQGLRLYDENLDIEAALRAVDGNGSEKVNPHDFVRVFKWQPMPETLGELRGAFDKAAKRRAVSSEVAIRRSKMAEENREHALSAEDEVATEEQRVLMERKMAQEGLRLKRQRKLKEMSGPPRLLVDWAVQQDLNDLQQLRYEVEQHRSVMALLHDLSAVDVKGVPVEELSMRYHELAIDLYNIPSQERLEAARIIKTALQQFKKNRKKQGLTVGVSRTKSKASSRPSTRGANSERVVNSPGAVSRTSTTSSARARWAGLEEEEEPEERQQEEVGNVHWQGGMHRNAA